MSARRAALALVLAAAASCARPPERAAPPAPTPTLPAAGAIALVPGLELSIVPNLPGVQGEDLPDLARREVEILEASGGRLRLKWTGQVRVEKPDSAKRREDWVRARANAPTGATPEPTIQAVYETREVGGVVSFPDFARATEFLLPGLWPEGNATVPGATALFISENALAELRGGGRAAVPLATSGPSLREPAATFLRRAIDLAAAAAVGRPGLWTAGPAVRFAVRVDGVESEVPALGARDWFAAWSVLDGTGPPLVLAALPQPPSSPAADLFAPTNALRSLLGYRIAEIRRPDVKK